jgi:hypothetical protein
MEPNNEKQHYERGIGRARWMAVVLMIAVVTVGIIGAQNDDKAMTPQSEPSSQRVEYQVTGTSKLVRIQYLNDMAFDATANRHGALGFVPAKADNSKFRSKILVMAR